MFALVMYGERATAPATTRARPAKNKAENRRAREMVFVLRWKICAISLFALQGERASRTRSSDAPPFQKARAWNNGNSYLPIKGIRMQTHMAPRNAKMRILPFSPAGIFENCEDAERFVLSRAADFSASRKPGGSLNWR